jgi:signal-transduction protein with cAMP-binding, CBS, and nucleotidyltransferase domain
MADTIADFLQKTEVFGDLSKDEIETLLPLVDSQEIKEGAFVFTSIEKGTRLYIVRSGQLVLNIDGIDRVIFGPGDSFGEVAVINNSLRTGSVRAIEDAQLYSIDREKIRESGILSAEIKLKIVIAIARKVARYLEPPSHIETSRLIEDGENDQVEFKSTLRYNIHSQKFGKEIEHAAIKSIAAFLNTSGGTLLIGVTDGQEAAGIEADQFENDDKALLHLTNLVKQRISMQHVTFIHATVEEIEGKKIMRVDVAPATMPAYVTYNQQEYLFIRTGPATTDLKVSEVYDYVYNRFFRPKSG